MKALIIALIAMNCMFFSCSRGGYTGPVIRGKLVYASCASAAVQVLDASQYSLGQSSWQQSPTSPVFNNVFTVENFCSFRAGTPLNVGDEFNFRLTTAGDTDCMVCMMADNPPTTKQKIYVVR